MDKLQGNQQHPGKAWAEILEGKSYGEANAAFLLRFLKSPYIKIPERYLNQPGLVLEPGCGSGKFSATFALLGHRVVVLDFVRSVVSGVRKWEHLLSKLPQRVGTMGTLLYCQGDLENLPFASNTFDLVINEGVIEHWLDRVSRVAVMREMARVTRQAGIVVVIVPNGKHPLIKKWEVKLEGFRNSPPMTHYDTSQLKEEMSSAGLSVLATDGIYPWRSWFRMKPWSRLYKIGALMDQVIPLPKSKREHWGINLIAIGRKP